MYVVKASGKREEFNVEKIRKLPLLANDNSLYLVYFPGFFSKVSLHPGEQKK